MGILNALAILVLGIDTCGSSGYVAEEAIAEEAKISAPVNYDNMLEYGILRWLAVFSHHGPSTINARMYSDEHILSYYCHRVITIDN